MTSTTYLADEPDTSAAGATGSGGGWVRKIWTVVVELRGIRGGDDHRVHRPGHCQRDRASADLRRRPGDLLQTPGRDPATSWLEAHRRRRRDRPRSARADGGGGHRHYPGRGRANGSDRFCRPTRPWPLRPRSSVSTPPPWRRPKQPPRTRAPSSPRDCSPRWLLGSTPPSPSPAPLVLGALIMYYLLKDGSLFRRSMVERTSPALRGDVDWFIGEACRILRDYGKGPHRDLRHRRGGDRRGQPPTGPPARFHDHRGELHRGLYPIHRRLPRWWVGRDRRPGRGRHWHGDRSCS